MDKIIGIQQSLFEFEELDSFELIKIVLGDKIFDKTSKDEYDLKYICAEEGATYTPRESTKINALTELMKRGFKREEPLKIFTPEDTYKQVKFLETYEEETVILLCLDTKHNLITKKIIFKGSKNTSTLEPSTIFKEALRFNAANIILSHTHPTGDPYPSKEDIICTQRIKNAGDVININLVDHVIVGNKSFVSFREKGLLY